MSPPPLRRHEWLTLGLITAMALAVRVWGLGTMPPGLWFDEGLNGLNALQVLRGEWPLYFNRHDLPQEPLHMYAIALALKCGFSGATAVRLPAALIGALTVPAAFACFREAFRANRTALIGAAGLAVMNWHVTFSHLGFRTIWVPLIACVSGWLTLRLLRRPSAWVAVTLGLTLAIGCHTYLAARLVPLFVLGILLWASVRRRWNPALGPRLEGVCAAAVVTLILGVAPLTVHLLRNPELALGRVSDIALFKSDANNDQSEVPPAVGQGHRALGGVGENLLANAWVFTMFGDHVPRHGLPREPIFDPVTAGLFLLGLWLALKRSRHDAGASLLLLWLGCLLLASVLSFGAPNRLRTLGAAPAAMGIAALGLHQAVVFTRGRWGRKAALSVAAIWLAWFAVLETARFGAWSAREDVWEQYSGPEMAIMSEIVALSEEDTVSLFQGWAGNDSLHFISRARDSPIYIFSMPQPPAQALDTLQPGQNRHHLFFLEALPQHRAIVEAFDAWNRPAGTTHHEILMTPSGKPFAHHLIIEPLGSSSGD
jgi:4-amino-4-deoxy-L-arabinose transferase-like glycosyltransferase